MEIEAWYSDNFETHLKGRYITPKHINTLLKKYVDVFNITSVGVSELGKTISLIKIGSGQKRVLAWSQMHGNETTTTKAIFDFLKFLHQKEVFQDKIRDFLETHTLYVIPILNPDGAEAYTRENSNLVDLNRDAQDLSQKESRILVKVFKAVKPDLCLNLHGQRTIFGLDNGLPATISFLSPSSNKEREVTPARKEAMKLIVKMNNVLQKYIPKQVGRYDDSFNSVCFGDFFQMQEIPVILFEAGHYKGDYRREKTREFIFYSFLALFGIINTEDVDDKEYFKISENKKDYKDFILRDIRLNEDDVPFSLAIQFTEELNNGNINFVPRLESINDLEEFHGHIDINGNKEVVLVNSQNKIDIGDKISIIISKNDNSCVYFNQNDI